MNENILTVESLTVTYKGSLTPALKDMSFDLGRGEVLGLFGRSGCGKSTFAWAAMGVIEAMGGQAHGKIYFNGKDLLAMQEKERSKLRWRHIAMVPQSSMNSLNPVYTIQTTLSETMSLYAPELKRAEITRRCEELIDTVRLNNRVLHSYPHELSGGMKQRVFIALAIMLNPELLLLDEATTGLDVMVEADILHTIMRIRKEKNISIIFLSHDARIQDAFCDRRIDL